MITIKTAPCAFSIIFFGLLSMLFPNNNLNVSAKSSPPTLETDLLIQAINPGYTSDQGSNTNEFIELKNESGGAKDLTGISLRYTYGSEKKQTIIYSFEEGSEFRGEYLVLRYDKSPEVKLFLADSEASGSEEEIALERAGLVADDYYSTTLAASGGMIEILRDNNYGLESDEADYEVLDSICWFNEDGCEKPLSGKRKGFSIYRSEEGFDASSEYEVHFDPENGALFIPEKPEKSEEDEELETEISGSESSSDPKDTSKTESEKSSIGTSLKPCAEGYERNPETNRCRKIKDETESELTPCADGYERNPETNRCRKIQTEEESTLKPCQEGYERNPETNRCRKIQTEESTLKECKEGYERNPETNRCRKIETEEESELAPCQEGYERNPETNRCRKIKENTGADYSVDVPETGEVEEKSTFVAIWAIIAIGIAGILYIFFQYKKELSQTIKKVLKNAKK